MTTQPKPSSLPHFLPVSTSSATCLVFYFFVFGHFFVVSLLCEFAALSSEPTHNIHTNIHSSSHTLLCDVVRMVISNKYHHGRDAKTHICFGRFGVICCPLVIFFEALSRHGSPQCADNATRKKTRKYKTFEANFSIANPNTVVIIIVL